MLVIFNTFRNRDTFNKVVYLIIAINKAINEIVTS